MKEETFKTLAPLLRFLRSYEVLVETKGARFLLRGRDFIHFHDDPDGLWADALLSKGRVRMSVSSSSEQGELMGLIAEKLDSLESHAGSGRKQRGNRHRRRDEG